jgi:hypothetical protein
MSEALANIKTFEGDGAEPASQLLALYEAGDEVGANKLTLTMIGETAEWIELDLPNAELAGERVRAWWLKQVRTYGDGEDADELEGRWDVAFEKVKAEPPTVDFGTKLDAALAKQLLQGPEQKVEAEPEPKANGTDAERVMLPAVVPPPPPLQPPKPTWDEALAAMNTQHAIIENIGGKTMIASWEPSPINLDRLMVVFRHKESFLLRYSNRFISIEVPDARGGTHTVRTPLAGR